MDSIELSDQVPRLLLGQDLASSSAESVSRLVTVEFPLDLLPHSSGQVGGVALSAAIFQSSLNTELHNRIVGPGAEEVRKRFMG